MDNEGGQMTATKHVSLTCDWCNREIKDGEQYFRIDTMLRGKATLWRDRQLKHCCTECMPSNIYVAYNKIEKDKMDNVTYRNSLSRGKTK